MSKEFPGKILLFGEYTIIIGSKALVLPFRKFSGRLEMPSEDREPVGSGSQPGQTDAQRSNDDLLGLLQYLEKLQAAGYMLGDFDIGRFMEQVIGGLYFHSSIPEAYGAGSSGALVAAIYDEFGSERIRRFESQDFSKLRRILGQIESYYHGTSSGIDPLCCYLNKPVLFDGDIAYPVNVPASPPGSGFFLLDSGRSGMTGPMIEYFKSRIQEPGFLDMINDNIIPLIERNIDSLLETDSRLSVNMQRLSEMQYTSFRRMIPQAFHRIWQHGLQTGLFSLKLCGSGGGGYIIGYTARWIEAMQYFNKPGFKLLPLDA
jgi:mevalonate kinase